VHTSVAAIIFLRGKYLLQRRDKNKNIYFPGFWGLFGGETKAGESLNFCIIRELKEELGLKFSTVQRLISMTFNFQLQSSNLFRKRVYFVCTLPSNFRKKLILHEGSEAKFFSNNKINPKSIVPWDYAAINYHNILKIKKKKIFPN
jgi:8-oxo-dGTP pyrophosphatase MutT (NUDIX family)